MAYTVQAFIQGIIPFVIMSRISLIMIFQNIDVSQIKSTFLTGIIISVVAASVIYDVNDWSLIKQSLIHFSYVGNDIAMFVHQQLVPPRKCVRLR